MSLINKMLQDLDARGGALGEPATPSYVRPVMPDQRRSPLVLAGGALLLAGLATGTAYGWRVLQHSRLSAATPTAVTAAEPLPVKKVLQAPVTQQAPVPEPVTAPVPQTPAPAAQAGSAAAPAPVVADESPMPVQAKAPDSEERPARRAQRATAQRPAVEKNAPAGEAVKPGHGEAVAPAASQLGVPQRAEAEYRRALAALQEGRTGPAQASLEQALAIDPRHEAARQTLVGLLIESGRPDEAARQLQQGLAADPRQPALAMLLARLQIEAGGTGIDTLQRTLPSAAGNAEYHALLAGALQRQQRHREAAEQYLAAVRVMPNNGVWLIGLGISLQADGRKQEAIEAFGKARVADGLTPELQAFVDRKVQQLSR